MKKIRSVILDFDGVLAESNEIKDAAFGSFFSRYPQHEEQMTGFHRANISLPRRKKFEYAAGLMGRANDSDLVGEMCDAFSELVRARVIAAEAVPGSLDFLREFSQKIPLYISSVTPQEELREILLGRNIDRYVVEAYGNPPTPKDEAIAKVLSREKLEPEEVAFIGDSISDYSVATSAGLVFWGRDSGQSFAGAAVELFSDLAEIAAVLKQRI